MRIAANSPVQSEAALPLEAGRPATWPLRSDYELANYLTARDGQIFLTGTQALVRLLVMQRWLDLERGLNTAGFVSGYRGSPLGACDQQLWRARKTLDAHQIRFLPAVNEELAATAVLGSQQAEIDPLRTADGVFAIWYGKGPGVDRAGDALKHGNAYGSSPHGGVLVVAGDDHGCMSSSMPHQSDLVMQSWSMPIVNPANIAEVLEFGLFGWALSRFSGAWVGLKAISETIESGSTVNLDLLRTRFVAPDVTFPIEGGLHYRWPDLPSLAIEARLHSKLEAVRAFARANTIDKTIVASGNGDLGIVTCGKAHLDLLESLRRLDISLGDLTAAGVRIYKVGLSFPIEPAGARAFVQGLKEVLVVEEKAPVVERQLVELFYNAPETARPIIIGKHDVCGQELLSSVGELRPSRIMPVLAAWLAKHRPSLDRRDRVIDFLAPELLSNEADAVKRVPYFCSGCPHNTSTKIPEGSRAQAGIGCHFMASWMPDRTTSGLIQMGGEGVDWVAHSMFTATQHVFQNLGDGTYYHSGYLAIRQSIAANSNITYKILYNDAVAMTGGQPVDGILSVDAIARQMESEGAKRVVVVSDEPEKFDRQRKRFPYGTTFHHRDALDAVQRELRDIPGVSVLIYDQTCAAEKRRRRKKGRYPDPPRRIFINSGVCEGCGDCGVQSNCLSIVPVATEFGRKRMIEQDSCNKDYSCVNGFCPSFVSVHGARVRRSGGGTFSEGVDGPLSMGRDAGEARLPVSAELPAQTREPGRASDTALEELAAALPLPAAHEWTGPYDLLVAGVGGTGVVTVGALITMAANLEQKSASVLDFMGFAQKGGMVLSYVRIADDAHRLNQVRIDTQQADAILACDMVVGASNDALQTAKRGRTRIIANIHEIQTAQFVHNAYADVHAEEQLEKMRFAAGADRVDTCDAQTLAQRVIGDTVGANLVLMGYAWQHGLIPVSREALDRAIELNGVAIDMNKKAFALGRLAAADARAVERFAGPMKTGDAFDDSILDLDAVIARRERLLTDYQNATYARRYRQLVDKAIATERAYVGCGAPLRVSAAVARSYARLLAYKDEYEVARLYANGDFARELARQFEGNFKLRFHMAPPLLSRPGRDGSAPRKITFGGWMWTLFKVLAKAKLLRGTPLDPFGYALERRVERELAHDYAATIEALLGRLGPDNQSLVEKIALLPERICGYGHVKLRNLRTVKRQEAELLRQLGVELPMGEATHRALNAAPAGGALEAIRVVASR
jgi:indolepyruvate ferredoxin oxidoreductase